MILPSRQMAGTLQVHSGMQKRPLAAHSESCLDLQKMLLTLPIFGQFYLHTYPYFGMLRTHFWQKIENRPKIAKFTVYIIFQGNFWK